MKFLKHILAASQTVLRQNAYRAALVPVALGLFSLFVAVPAVAIPSNTIAIQLSLYALTDYITLSLLSVLATLFILMNVYAYRTARADRERIGAVAKASVGGVIGTLASIFGAAKCPLCIAALFSFLGFGTVGFLAQHQWWVFLVAIMLLLSSLYITSRKINGLCASCMAPP